MTFVWLYIFLVTVLGCLIAAGLGSLVLDNLANEAPPETEPRPVEPTPVEPTPLAGHPYRAARCPTCGSVVPGEGE